MACDRFTSIKSFMRTDDFKDHQSDHLRDRADLDLCLSLIRKFEIQLETAINLQFLASLETLTAGQVEGFRLQLCEHLELMGETMFQFQTSRAKPSRT